MRLLALHETADAGAARVGGKAFTLGRLAVAGFVIPAAVVIPVGVWDEQRRAAGLGERPDPREVTRIQLSGATEALLGQVREVLGAGPIVVRSSAVGEDGEGASFAGQYETVLGVRGEQELRDAIRQCWAGAFTERALAYRKSHGQHGPAALALLVQHQVDADVAGVAFTADPVSGDRDQVLVSAVPGLGNVLVDGSVRPDEWRVGPDLGTPVRVEHQALAEPQARAVAELARRVETELGGPVDIEWAMADGQLQLLQARPITALPVPPEVSLPPGTWVKETDRSPEPLTGLGASLVPGIVARGMSRVFAESGGLLERLEVRSVGGELYLHVVPPGGHEGTPPPWWLLGVLARALPSMRRRMRAARRTLEPGRLASVADRWWLVERPELQRRAARLRAVDLTALDDAGLADHLRETRAQATDAMRVHFEMTMPYLVPVHALVRVCGRLLQWPEERALGLLAGNSRTTTAPGREVAELAARIMADPRARDALTGPADEIADRLEAADVELASAFRGWLDRHAWRNVHNDPGSPVFAEVPELVQRLLVEAADRSEGADAAAELRAEARALLQADPAGRAEFDRVLSAAETAYPLREDVACWTGSTFSGILRVAAIEAGRRLVAQGRLDRAEDAVMLSFDTLVGALSGEPTVDLRAEQRRARSERAWVRSHPGPAHHGAQPSAPPDLRALPAAGRRVNEVLLWSHSAAPTTDRIVAGDGVAGSPASPGRHTGRVRVVRGVDDFGRLRAGDVLVCPTTDPAWTVLFPLVGAVITEGSGVLSHAAIVAREYAIPAVVGVRDATRTLVDDQLVTVDGGTGHVALETP